MSKEYSLISDPGQMPSSAVFQVHRAVVPLLCALLTGCSTTLAQLPTRPFERAVPLAGSTKAEAPLATTASSPLQPPLSRGASMSASTAGSEADAVSLPSDAPVPAAQATPPQGGSVAVGSEASAKPLINVNAVAAPLDSVLYALASEAGYELGLSGELNTPVTLKLEQVSLPDIMHEVAAQLPISWAIEGRRLKLWAGAVYPYSYSIDYLNMHRRTQSSVGLATQVGTINAADNNAGSVANSSQTRVDNLSEHRFWESIDTDISGLLSHSRVNDEHASPESPPHYSINREAGLLTLSARPAVHQAVQNYLARLHDSAQRQVLIEATVVEVTLADRFQAGVDWQVLAAGVNGFSAAQVLLGSPVVNANTANRLTPGSGLISMTRKGSKADISGTLSLLEEFGDVRILSRPRIIALNNQSAVLKVVDNRVYFTAKVERSNSETRDEVITETDIHTVPVGLVMNVTPQISGDGAIMLNVRPSLSRILGFVNDPNPELAQANVQNGVPEIQVREMESMLRVHSGELAIIGGLMQETTEKNHSGLPGLRRLPLLGHLFSQQASKRRQTELLIVLRPTVMGPSSMMADRT